MPVKVRIITNAVSDGARALGETLENEGVNVSRVRVSAGPKTPPRLNIKWGCFPLNPRDYGGDVLNARAGETSLNKLMCLEALSQAEVPVPEFTTDLVTAQRWLDEGGRRVYQRNMLRASEGDGIVVVEKNAEGQYLDDNRLSNAPLYTKGLFGERREYRIHVFTKDGIRRLFIQQKRMRTTGMTQEELDNRNGRVRNLAGGWVFAHNEIDAPRQQTIDIAVRTVEALGLNFGGIDLIEMGDERKGSFVLEVNCAPGLQGATLNFYSQCLRDLTRGVVDEGTTRAATPATPRDDMRRVGMMQSAFDVEDYGSEGDPEDDYDDDDY